MKSNTLIFLDEVAKICGLEPENDPDHKQIINEIKKAMKIYLNIEEF